MGTLLPEELRPAFVAAQRKLAAVGSVKWVEAANLHLTLRFLGDVAETDLERLTGALDRAAAVSRPGSLVSSRLTAFPRERAARVLVVELADEGDRVAELQRAIERELASVGIPEEERPFRTHLTLGRVRTDAIDARDSLSTCDPPRGTWEVGGFALLSSRLSSRGPAYEVVKAFSLHGGADGTAEAVSAKDEGPPLASPVERGPGRA